MSNLHRNWQIIAHDYKSSLLRNYTWVRFNAIYSKVIGVPVPLMSIACYNDAIDYMTDFGEFKKSHDALRAKCQSNPTYLESLIDTTESLGVEFRAWADAAIWSKNPQDLSNDALADLVDQTIIELSTLTGHGMALPTLDFGNFAYVENNLNNFLQNNVAQEKYEQYYRVFTAPLHPSFALDQEIALLELMKKYYSDPLWKNAILLADREVITQQFPQFWHDLSRHAHQFGWVYYVFSGPAFNETQFLQFIQEYLKKFVDPSNKLHQIKTEQQETKRLREQYIKELAPNQFNEMIVRLAGKMVWAKPRRKEYEGYLYYSIEPIMREIGRRLGLSLRQARAIPPTMIRDALKTEKIDVRMINSLLKQHICIPEEDGTVTILQGDAAQQFINQYCNVVAEKFANVHELHGSCACKGNAYGAVKIVNTSEDMHKMNDGDILVAIATSPAVVPAMRRAAAIVTDEGGLTCHAAIVSRELGIPCVVGTKVATSAFKDGDIVEVDADKGIVKILKKA